MSLPGNAEPPSGLSRYSPERPLLLWSDFPPTAGGGGAVILRSLLSPQDRERMVWASAEKRDPAAAPSTAWLTRGSAGRGRRSLFLDTTFYARALADETLRVASERNARAIWVIMHGAGVPVAAELARRKALPLHLTVHDDPAFASALRSRRYLALTPWIERCFARAVRGATSLDVISTGMAERYRRRYGVASSVVHRGVPGPISPSGTYDARTHGLRIGLMGATYAHEQLPVLARAVARAARELGVPARLRILGRGSADRLRAEMRAANVDVAIEGTGHVDENDGVKLLRECFLLYVNYPFGRRDAVLGQTSFPTKLSTYVMAARPVLAHAPRGTTLEGLSSFPGYARPWTNMEEEEGAAILTRAWRSPETSASAHELAEAVRLRYYDHETNARALFGALNGLVPIGAS